MESNKGFFRGSNEKHPFPLRLVVCQWCHQHHHRHLGRTRGARCMSCIGFGRENYCMHVMWIMTVFRDQITQKQRGMKQIVIVVMMTSRNGNWMWKNHRTTLELESMRCKTEKICWWSKSWRLHPRNLTNWYQKWPMFKGSCLFQGPSFWVSGR